MIEINDRQQLFENFFEEAFFPTVAGVIAVSPVGGEPYGGSDAARQDLLPKTFSKVLNG